MTEAEKTIKYIRSHAQKEIDNLRLYLKTHQIIIIPLAQKMGGKSYYLQFFAEAIDPGLFVTLSAGNIVRALKKDLEDTNKRAQLENKLAGHFANPAEALDSIINSDSGKLVPDDVIFYFLEEEIKKLGTGKSVVLDGIPRSKAQIEFVKKLEKDLKIPTFFFYFDTDYEVLDLRADSRRFCTKCSFAPNILSMPSSKLEYRDGEIIMFCDRCGTELVKKQIEGGKEAVDKARKSYDELMEELKKAVGSKLIWIKTGTLVSEYKGPKEEVNRQFTYKVEGEKVLAEEGMMVINSARGPIYAMSPEFSCQVMIKEIGRACLTLPTTTKTP